MKTIDAESGAIVLQVPEGLEPITEKSLKEAFATYFEQAETWRAKALAIQVSSADDKTAMAAAREARLELKGIRVAAEKARKRLKEDSLRKGRAIDGIYNMLEFAIKPLEEHLESQEKYALRLEMERMEKLRQDRLAQLEGLDHTPAVDLGQLTEDQWRGMLQDAKDLHELKKERERKAEEERIAREKAEAEERERIRLENERLKVELAAQEENARMERLREQALREVERQKAEAERAKLEAERLAAEEVARKEREAAEAKARAEREAREKAEAEARALREAEEQRQRAEAERQAAEARAAKERARRERAAPDKTKLAAFGERLLQLELPECKSEDGTAVLAEIEAKLIWLNEWINDRLSKI